MTDHRNEVRPEGDNEPQILEIQGSREFQTTVLDSDKPVFVKFTAEWCGPCKALDPVMESLSREYSHKIAFAKVDIDQNLDLAKNFKVRSVPTTLFVKSGKASHVVAGKKNDDWYRQACEEILNV